MTTWSVMASNRVCSLFLLSFSFSVSETSSSFLLTSRSFWFSRSAVLFWMVFSRFSFCSISLLFQLLAQADVLVYLLDAAPAVEIDQDEGADDRALLAAGVDQAHLHAPEKPLFLQFLEDDGPDAGDVGVQLVPDEVQLDRAVLGVMEHAVEGAVGLQDVAVHL